MFKQCHINFSRVQEFLLLVATNFHHHHTKGWMGNMAKPEKVPRNNIRHLWLFFPLLSELFSISHPNVVFLSFHFLSTTPSSLLGHHLSIHWPLQRSRTWTAGEAATPWSWLFLTGISLKKKMKRILMKKTKTLMKQWLSLMVESTTNAMTILKLFGTMLKSPPEHWFMESCNVQLVFTTSSTRFI